MKNYVICNTLYCLHIAILRHSAIELESLIQYSL